VFGMQRRRGEQGTTAHRHAWRSPGFLVLLALLSLVVSLVLVAGDDDPGDELALGTAVAAAGDDDHTGHGESHGDDHTDGHGEGHVDDHGDDHGDGHTTAHGAAHTTDHGTGHDAGHAAGGSGHGHEAGSDHGGPDGHEGHPPDDHGDGHPPAGPGENHNNHPPSGPTCDLGQPVTIHGSFTPQQCSAAQQLIVDVKSVLQAKGFADHRVAEAAGYHSIRDDFVVASNGQRYEHFVNWDYLGDNHVMNPQRVESLVYRIGPGGTKVLESGMFILPLGQTSANIPSLYASPLTPWHIHTNLCWDLTTPTLTIGAIKKNGVCPAGTIDFPTPPMLHVWIVPTPCGPFAEVEGAGGNCQHVSH
jgi:hypothetical protein